MAVIPLIWSCMPTSAGAQELLDSGRVSVGGEALTIAVDSVVTRLGSTNGFNGDPQVRIPLPAPLGKIQSTLQKAGFGSQMEHLQLRLNVAAEAAVKQAHGVFLDAVGQLSFPADAVRVYQSSNDGATRYLEATSFDSLANELRPIVAENLDSVGASQALARVVDQYHALPLSQEVDSDLTGYVVDRVLDSVFRYLALEVEGIRRNSVQQTSTSLERPGGQ